VQPQLPLSLVIITLNEELNIERCIRSAPFASEIIVLDSGSQDRTVEIAESLGAKVTVEPFRGFREQKIRAVELASHDWILSLDADEALGLALQAEILDFWKAGTPSCAGFEMPRLSYHLGQWIHHGGWYPDTQLRLFNRRFASWTGGNVHERVTANGEVVSLDADLQHYVFRNLAHQVDTNNLYSTEGARDLQAARVSFHLPLLLIKPVSKFLETYFFKLGLLDGMPGFLISVSAAYSMFLKHAKLWEHRQKIRVLANSEHTREPSAKPTRTNGELL
jgi:glycosyltransferase involved in cell wall biosynthesis